MFAKNVPDEFSVLKTEIFQTLGIACSASIDEPESREYMASSFAFNKKHVQYRCAKITPTKVGQFVTLWKRDAPDQEIRPYNTNDKLDVAIICARQGQKLGYFIFPLSTLTQQGIVQKEKAGKRGFRVYPTWDQPTSKQALKTQQWQEKYFVELHEGHEINIEHISNILSQV